MFRNRLPRMLRARLVDAVSRVYIKTLDPTTGMFYYFNTRTEESSWEKPPELAMLAGQGVDIEETEYDGTKAELAALANSPAQGDDGDDADGVSISTGSSSLGSYGTGSSNGADDASASSSDVDDGAYSSGGDD